MNTLFITHFVINNYFFIYFKGGTGMIYLYLEKYLLNITILYFFILMVYGPYFFGFEILIPTGQRETHT